MRTLWSKVVAAYTNTTARGEGQLVGEMLHNVAGQQINRGGSIFSATTNDDAIDEIFG